MPALRFACVRCGETVPRVEIYWVKPTGEKASPDTGDAYCFRCTGYRDGRDLWPGAPDGRDGERGKGTPQSSVNPGQSTLSSD